MLTFRLLDEQTRWVQLSLGDLQLRAIHENQLVEVLQSYTPDVEVRLLGPDGQERIRTVGQILSQESPAFPG